MTSWGSEPRSCARGSMLPLKCGGRQTGSLGPLLGLVQGLAPDPLLNPKCQSSPSSAPAPTPKPGVCCLYPLLGSGSNTKEGEGDTKSRRHRAKTGTEGSRQGDTKRERTWEGLPHLPSLPPLGPPHRPHPALHHHQLPPGKE